MKFVVVFATFFAIAIAAPLDDSRSAQIVKYENDNIGIEGYKFAYETSDGIQRQEQGEVKNFGPEQDAVVVRGTVSWVADDGQTYSYTYEADENGFRPSGAHLPQ